MGKKKYTGMNFFCAEVKLKKTIELDDHKVEKGEVVTISHPYTINNIEKKYPEYDPNKHCILWCYGTWVTEQKVFDVKNPVKVISELSLGANQNRSRKIENDLV